MVSPVIPKILDVFIPQNESRPLKTLMAVEYFTDNNEYFWLIYLHNVQASIGIIFSMITLDCYYLMIIHNAIGMFDVLR